MNGVHIAMDAVALVQAVQLPRHVHIAMDAVALVQAVHYLDTHNHVCEGKPIFGFLY